MVHIEITEEDLRRVVGGGINVYRRLDRSN